MHHSYYSNLSSETEGLKRIISQLEERLSDLMAEQSDIEVDLKNDLNAVRQSHQSTEKENNCLKEEVRNLTQEVKNFLKTNFHCKIFIAFLKSNPNFRGFINSY